MRHSPSGSGSEDANGAAVHEVHELSSLDHGPSAMTRQRDTIGFHRSVDADPEGGSDMDRVYSIDEIRAMVRPLLAKYDMASASLFGSYARGVADGGSDIDVILYANQGCRPLNVFGVAEELHRASGKRVDVYEISEIDPSPFRDAALREAVAL